jgi:GH43 family beta-xylosidase
MNKTESFQVYFYGGGGDDLIIKACTTRHQIFSLQKEEESSYKEKGRNYFQWQVNSLKKTVLPHLEFPYFYNTTRNQKCTPLRNESDELASVIETSPPA